MSDFRVLREIGRGGNGVAYLVQPLDKPSEQYVIKQVDLGTMEQFQRDASLREVKILQCMQHANIIKIYEASMKADKSDSDGICG
jgi:serine/threonine protein kinase